MRTVHSVPRTAPRLRAIAVAAVLTLTGLLPSLTPGPAEAQFPGVTGRIFFASSRDGDFEIFSMAPDGSDETQLTFNAVFEAGPNPCPGGDPVVFVRAVGGADTEIMLMSPDGTVVTPLTSNSVADDFPYCSPDGTTVYFSRKVGGADYEIMAHDIASGSETVLTADAVAQVWPVPSPDGSKLAYFAPGGPDGGADFELFVLDLVTGLVTALTTNTVTDSFSVDWHPDGTKLAFVSALGGDLEIYEIGLDGTGLTPLTANSVPDIDVVYSPKDKIVFARDVAGPAPYDIYVKDLSSGTETKLTDAPAADIDPGWASLAAGTCTISGGPGPDVLSGTSADDVVCGFGGPDYIDPGPGDDDVLGGSGDDEICTAVACFRVGETLSLVPPDSGVDTVDGGTGFDTCIVGPEDIVVGCEIVTPG